MVLFVSQHRTHQSYFAEPFSGLNEQNARIYRYSSNFPCTTERWWFFYMQTKFLFIYLRNWHLETFFFFSFFPFFLLVSTLGNHRYTAVLILNRAQNTWHWYYSYTCITIHLILFSFFYYSRKKLFYSNTALLIRLIVFHLHDKITDDQ